MKILKPNRKIYMIIGTITLFVIPAIFAIYQLLTQTNTDATLATTPRLTVTVTPQNNIIKKQSDHQITEIPTSISIVIVILVIGYWTNLMITHKKKAIQ